MGGGPRNLYYILAGVTLLFQLAASTLGNAPLTVYRTPDLIDFSFRFDPDLWHVHEERVLEYSELTVQLQHRHHNHSLRFDIRPTVETGFGEEEPDRLTRDNFMLIPPWVRVPYPFSEDISFIFLHEVFVYLEADTMTIWDYGVPITIEASAQFIDQLYGNYPLYPIGYEHPPRVWLSIVTDAPEALIGEVDSIIASLTFRRCTSYDEPCESTK
jgi:hypothetical protein